MPTIPQDLAVALAAIAILLSHWLQGDSLPARTNAIIAGSAFVVLSVATDLLIGMSGGVREAILTIITIGVFLGYNELAPLLQYLNSLPSPLVARPTSVRPTVTDCNKKYQPPQQG